MGASESKELLDLIKDPKLSKYTKMELKQWGERFKERYTTGYITETEFKDLYSNIHASDNSSPFAEHLYRLFDRNKDNMVTFKEFMVAISVSCRGSIREKIEWMFGLFDVDEDGRVTKKEMTAILTAMYKMQTTQKKTPEAHVEEIFKKLDRNRDGYLTLDEFVSLGNTDPQLVEIACSSGNALAGR